MRTEKLFPKMVVGFPGRSTILWPYPIFAPGNGDEKAKVAEAETQPIDDIDLKGLASWAHQKSGHLGEKPRIEGRNHGE
ncbi:hypothetical protein XELAEV_18037221mg [Xenopus laevis]|uniref:Uncharacterized protein n=1 Tax=Xenopus laevis TaxID=8355 RepID=A0A974CBU0_XENLA|nr:hypothetical protein XELAEV_18037221mg [Xenopus laevis]